MRPLKFASGPGHRRVYGGGFFLPNWRGRPSRYRSGCRLHHRDLSPAPDFSDNVNCFSAFFVLQYYKIVGLTQQSGKLLFVERTLALPSGEGGRAPARSGEVSPTKEYSQRTFDTPSVSPFGLTAPPEGEPSSIARSNNNFPLFDFVQ